MTSKLLLALSVLLAGVGGAALASGVGPAAPTTVSLSSGNDTPTTEALTVGDDDTTTTTAAPPTATTSTTEAARPTTTSTVVDAPSTTTSTTAPANTSIIFVKNSYPGSVTIGVADETSNTWVLAPGESAGPWTLENSLEHADNVGVRDVNTQCGYGDPDNSDSFKPGHTYLLEAVPYDQICNTDTGDIPGPIPVLVVHDETTGGTEYVAPGGHMPTTG